MAQSLYYHRLEKKAHMEFLVFFLVLQGFPTSAQSTTSSSSTTSSGLPRIIAPPSSPPPKSHTASVGLAIGIVLGVLGVFVLGLLTWWVVRNRRRKRETAAQEWLRGIGGGSPGGREGGSGQRESRGRSDTTGKYTTSSGGSWSPKANSASPTSAVQPHAQFHPHAQELNRGAVGANAGIWTRIKDLFSLPSSTAAVHAPSPQGTWPPPLGMLAAPGMDPNQAYYPYSYDPNSPHNAYGDPNMTPYNPYDPNYAPPYPTYPHPYPNPNPNPNLYQAPYGYPYDPNTPPNRAPNRYIPGYTLSTITEKSTPQSFANRSLRHGGASSVIIGGAGGGSVKGGGAGGSVNVGAYSPMSGLTVSEELGGAGYWTASEGGHEADGGELGMAQSQNQIGGLGTGGEQKEGKREKRKKDKKDKKHKKDSHEGEKKSDYKEKRTSWFRS